MLFKIKTLITSIVITSAMMTTLCDCRKSQNENPLLKESGLPYGTPDFSKIKNEDYLPAFEYAIQQTRDEIAKIVENKDSANFENTILAYEDAGRVLDRVSRIFFALTEADKTPELSEIEKKRLFPHSIIKERKEKKNVSKIIKKVC
jgi:peptidyl-dipeptidase Dcp